LFVTNIVSPSTYPSNIDHIVSVSSISYKNVDFSSEAQETVPKLKTKLQERHDPDWPLPNLYSFGAIP
jgi:hypothetical protein